jgi:ParB family chromosome partitioning protein
VVSKQGQPKHGLGKGLSALIPLEEEAPPPQRPAIEEIVVSLGGDTAASAVAGTPFSQELHVPLSQLRANPNQPRKFFDEASLEELAASIREHGILQPIIVEDSDDGTLLIVAGERRFRAATRAGLTEVPVIVRSYSDELRMEITLIENIQRTDLNPIEEAAAYRQLMDITGLSQDEIAVKVGKNRSTVANALRLLKLPVHIRESLQSGNISSGHARAILSVNDPQQQETLYREILTKGMSVRDAEKRAAELNSTKVLPQTKPVKSRNPHLAAIEEKFIETLGTKVSIEGGLSKGHIRIDYFSMEDLDRLYNLLEKKQ